jgi:serine phosphatase RsbU (regulator of sigma subunit)
MAKGGRFRISIARWARWEQMRATPWKRLWLFLVAASLLFSVFGFFFDLLNMGTSPHAVVLVLAFFSGLNCALWIVVIYKTPRVLMAGLIAGMVVLQFFNGTLMTMVARWMTRRFGLHEVATKPGVEFAATGIVVVIMISYFFFIGFIRAEGKESYRIRSELELAHGIQKTLVPPVALRTEQYEVYGISEPSDKVGGDLVDAVLLPNGDVVAYLADIAGHGLPAGILMGMLKTAARTALLDAATGHPSGTLPLLLEKLNRILPDVKEPQMYATLTAFRLNADGRAWYAMAASPPILHWSPQRQDWRRTEEEQFPLGLLPVEGFTGAPIELAAGDLVVVATDGVLEVCNRAQEEFGIERVERAIAADAHAALPQLAGEILERARAFGKQGDDQTLLLIRRL